MHSAAASAAFIASDNTHSIAHHYQPGLRYRPRSLFMQAFAFVLRHQREWHISFEHGSYLK